SLRERWEYFMTTGYILILAVLVLGGAIATAGDRIGTKVGKARLSLFKLRPRQTATLITILSGSLVAASTLGILLAADKQLRTGLFELDKIQQDLRKAKRELRKTGDRKSQVERELAQAQAEQAKAKQQLEKIEVSLKEVSVKLDEAIEKQALTDEQLVQTQEDLRQTEEELTQVDRERDRASQERSQVATQLDLTLQQKDALQSEIETLQNERQQLVEQREATIGQITERDREIQQNQQFIANQQQQIETQQQQVALQQQRMKSQQQQVENQQQAIQGQQQEIKSQEQQLDKQKDVLLTQERTLAQREALLRELEEQRVNLSEQVDNLERGFRLLRERRVAIGRGQVLASGVIRIVQPFGARQAIDGLLQEANRVATGLIRPGTNPNEQIIQIPITEMEEWMGQIQDGNEYVMRVLAAENYTLGEEVVGVYLEAERNRLVFEAGETISATSIDPTSMSEDEVLDRMEFLIEAARLRALQEGILAERIQVSDSRESAIEFIQQLQAQQEPLEVQAISTDLTYTAGPLKLKLVAFGNDGIVFESR
ncbi:MAG: DUF3084 domain-containing protein, partial [Geitlerinemataceae cyanobacterium]